MLRKLLVVLGLALLLSGCAMTVVPVNQDVQTLLDELDCNNPQGREYYCYSEEECGQFFAGYGAVVIDRIYHQRYKGWYPNVDIHVVHVNVVAEYDTGWYYIGRIEAKRAGDEKIWMKFILNIYDMDCNLLHSGEREGYLNQAKPIEEKKSYEQNSFKLEATRR